MPALPTAALIALLLGSSADAAELAYSDALSLALERNPSLLGAQQDLRSADGALLAARVDRATVPVSVMRPLCASARIHAPIALDFPSGSPTAATRSSAVNCSPWSSCASQSSASSDHATCTESASSQPFSASSRPRRRSRTP